MGVMCGLISSSDAAHCCPASSLLLLVEQWCVKMV